MQRPWLSFTSKLVITGALLYMVVRNVDRSALVQQVAQMDLGGMGFVLALLALQSLLAAARWAILLAALGPPVSYGVALKLWAIGAFFNQTLPTAIGGDVMRVWQVFQLKGSLRQAANGVALDRLVGVAALVLLAAATQPLMRTLVPDALVRSAVITSLLAAAALLTALLFADRLPAGWRRLTACRALSVLSADARASLLDGGTWRRGMVLIGMSVVIHLLTISAIALIAQSLGTDLRFWQCAVLVPPVLLAQALPISIAGWGVREGAMVSALYVAGVAPAASLAISLLFGVALLCVGIPGGVLWLSSSSGKQVQAMTWPAASTAGLIE